MTGGATAVAAPAYPTLDYDLWAQSRPRDDLWGQVRRTVGGAPVPEADIRAITDRIGRALDLGPRDVLIDFACGNGALGTRLLGRCGGYLGSDISPYLIGVAEERFEVLGRAEFLVRGAARHARTEPSPGRFTRALCYGSFAYFGDAEAEALLEAVHRRFPAVTRLFLGNLPDPGRAAAFYGHDLPSEAEMRDPASRIGVWRGREEILGLAARTGWSAALSTMPAGFFAAHYRFDALLTRREGRG